jgi:hypothetical protein
MPWADPEKNAEAVRRWRAAHPGYSSHYAHPSHLTQSRYSVLEEDIKQQTALYRLSRCKADDPAEYRRRERRWIQTTDFWILGDDNGQDQTRRRTRLND